MATIHVNPTDSIEVILKRFNKKVQNEQILTELKKREFYEKPSVARKRELASRRRKGVKFSAFDR